MDHADLERIGRELIKEGNDTAISIVSFHTLASDALVEYTKALPLLVRVHALKFLDVAIMAMVDASKVSVEDLQRASASLNRASKTVTELAKLDETEHAVNGYDPCI